ncbi:aldo/keto reductase [Actinoplanes couchii]|uniref:Oxidoreductase n=1 Tax=Actinoplanes couchii TaxID=403638 RepID=A0ABQ3X0I7_9ACTN|nr:aldo/keto reductase [Actinoplanes couchii]MDR6316302.1 aryl-alcohol dehydrogenase-like predicted oxidoreductase [Actinoplanes couchii]GID51915.1 oxidoreductase [Actinoplanes couchii]
MTNNGTFTIGGDLTVNRIGYGTMQIVGPGYWGEPRDRSEAIAVLRRAVELGVNFIDTADAYGPFVAEDLIREALHPYRDDLVIATKGGVLRTGPDEWPPLGRPEYLRQALEMSLRRLGVDHVDLYQLHRIDPVVPLEDSLGELARMQKEGKIRHIGLSEVSVAEIEAARPVADVVSVQNMYNLSARGAEDVLEHTRTAGMAFIPWFPMATGELARPGGVLAAAADRHGVTPAQLALSWLLHRAPNVIPIPGTSRIAHLEENVAAATVSLSPAEVAELTALVR